MRWSCLLSYTDHVPLEAINKELSRHESNSQQAIIIFGKERLPAFKDIPSSYELGYQIALPQFRSYVVKAGTPPERVKILSDAMAKVAAEPEFKAFLEENYAAKGSFLPADEAEPYF